MRTRKQVLPYSKDNSLNIFGDYVHLQRFQREGEPAVWSLEGPGRTKLLSPEEAQEALENLFVFNATDV